MDYERMFANERSAPFGWRQSGRNGFRDRHLWCLSLQPQLISAVGDTSEPFQGQAPLVPVPTAGCTRAAAAGQRSRAPSKGQIYEQVSCAAKASLATPTIRGRADLCGTASKPG